MKISISRLLNWYHLSDSPNLVVDAKYKPRLGEMGQGFYVTSQPKAWADSLDRKCIYKILNSADFKIATDGPSPKQLIEWAIVKGFMEIKTLTRDNGEIILSLEGKPLKGAVTTPLAHKFMWQDPMSGNRMNGLENLYLKEHGFDGLEASYSPEGHQIILFDASKVRLKLLKGMPK